MEILISTIVFTPVRSLIRTNGVTLEHHLGQEGLGDFALQRWLVGAVSPGLPDLVHVHVEGCLGIVHVQTVQDLTAKKIFVEVSAMPVITE